MRDRLAAISRAQLRVKRFSRCISVAAAWLLVVLCGLLVDATSPLPDWLRLTASVVLLAGLIASLLRRGWCDTEFSNASNDLLIQARRAERRMGVAGNPLVNAVGLVGVGHPLGQALADRAASIGQRTLDGATTDWTARERAALGHTGGYLWLATIAWLVTVVVWPGLIACELARFAAPFADHPPFSLTRLDVHVTPAHPALGHDAAVVVRLAGEPVDHVSLVTLDSDNEVRGRWRMERDRADRFTRTLVGVRGSIRFRIQAGTARSRVFNVTPQLPAGHLKSGVKRSGTRQTSSTQPAGGQKVSEHRASSSGSQNLGQRLSDLLTQAETIAKQARAAGKTPGDEKSLAAAIRQFRAAAARLKDAKGAPAAIRSTIASRVAILNLMRIHFPGQNSLPNKSPDKGGSKGQARADWSGAVARGAAADAKALAGLMTVIGATPGTSEKSVTPNASGTYQESAAAEKQAASVQALVDQAPPAYRSQVRAYFDRLAQDAGRQAADKEKR